MDGIVKLIKNFIKIKFFLVPVSILIKNYVAFSVYNSKILNGKVV